MTHRLRVAWFSPLSGGSISSYVSQQLLPVLAEKIELTVFHSGERSTFSTAHGDIPVLHYLKAVECDERIPFDIFFYQLEDRKECDFMRIHLALKPGIVWFHDLFLSNHGPEPILNSSWTEIIARFGDLNREWPAHDRTYESSGFLAEREAGMSFLPLFSNPRDHSEYRRLILRRIAGTETRSLMLRHPVSDELFSQVRKRAAGEPLTIALSALPRVESQSHHFFDALDRLAFKGKVLWPVPAQEVGAACQIAAEFGFADRCAVIEGDGPAVWQQTLTNADAGVHLRFSAFGQPSPYLAMTLAAGLPAIVTDFAAGAVFPDSVVFKVVPGAEQIEEIAHVIRTIQSQSSEYFTNTSRRFAQEFFSRAGVACQLIQILTKEAPQLARLSARWRELEYAAKGELMREARTLALADGAAFSEEFRQVINPILAELGWEGIGRV